MPKIAGFVSGLSLILSTISGLVSPLSPNRFFEKSAQWNINHSNVFSIVIDNKSQYTRDKSVELTFTHPSSYTKMRVSNSIFFPLSRRPEWIDIPNTIVWNIQGGDGKKTVHAQFFDIKSNTGSDVLSASIILDTRAPSGTMFINNGQRSTSDKHLSIQFIAFDILSGLDKVRMGEDENLSSQPWIDFQQNIPYELSDNKDKDSQKHKIYAQMRDNAGNESKIISSQITLLEKPIISPTQTPTPTITSTPSPTPTNTPTPTLTPTPTVTLTPTLTPTPTLNPPQISSLEQSNGFIGDFFKILGNYFGNFITGISKVLFQEVPATVTSWTETVIEAIIPEGAKTGKVKVANQNGEVESAEDFSVLKYEGPTEVPCTDIAVDTSWQRIKSPYIVNCSIYVRAGVTLTIEKGAIVKFGKSDARLQIAGNLNASATDRIPIYFTSIKDDSALGDTNGDGTVTSPQLNDWYGLRFDIGAQVTLDHVKVKYAVNGISGPGHTGSKLSVKNSEITNNKYNGINTEGIRGPNDKPVGGTIEIVSNNVSNNGQEGIAIGGGDLTYHVDNPTIPLIEGNTVENNGNKGIYTGARLVSAIITNNKVNSNEQDGIYGWGFEVMPDIHENKLSNNKGYAITTQFYSGGHDHAFYENSGTGNGKNGIFIQGMVNNNTEFGLNSNLPLIMGQVDLRADTSFVPGSIVKFSIDSPSENLNKGYIRIHNSGVTFTAKGTEQTSTIFTSLRDDSVLGDTNGDGTASVPQPGDWEGISFEAGTQVLFDYTKVQYTIFGINGPGYSGSVVKIKNSKISNNIYYGIHTSSLINWFGSDPPQPATIEIIGNTITNSQEGISIGGGDNVYYVNNPTIPIIDGNTIEHSTQNGITLSNRLESAIISNNKINDSGFSGISGWGLATMPDVHDNQVNNSKDYAIYMRFASGGRDKAFYGNSGTGNRMNGIYLNSAIRNATDFGTNGNLAYIIEYLDVGAPTTFQPGSVVKFTTKSEANKTEKGQMFLRGKGTTFTAQGTEQIPIIFTSLRDDSVLGDTNGDGEASSPQPSDWEGISFGMDPGHQVLFDHVKIRYAGTSFLVRGGAKINFNNGEISFSNEGINLRDYNYGDVSIHNSRIFNNVQYAIFNYADAKVDATNNWWGHESGPFPLGSGDKVNYVIKNYPDGKVYFDLRADVYPWIGEAYWVKHNLGKTSHWQVSAAEPVNTATGNYYVEQNDLAISTVSEPLQFSRYYNAVSGADGPLGFGWSFSYQIKLEKLVNGDVVVTYHDGKQDLFKKTDTGYLSPAGTFSSLTEITGGYLLTEKSLRKLSFDSVGKLVKITDRNNNQTILEYTSEGNLTKVTEPKGRAFTFTYNSGKLTQVTDPLNRAIKFSYDASGNLSSFTDPANSVTSYEYDDNHRLTKMTDSNGNTVVRNIYDTDGRVIEQYDGFDHKTTFEFDSVNRKTTVTDPRGGKTVYAYDPGLRLIVQTDPLGNSEKYEYDTSNNRTKITDKRGNISTFTYDDHGNTLKKAGPAGEIYEYSYDTADRPLSIKDPLGRIVSNIYDTKENLTQISHPDGSQEKYSYNPDGTWNTYTDVKGNSYKYKYDAYGSRTEITDPLNNISKSESDIAGRVVKKTDTLGNATTYEYDANDRITKITDTKGQKRTNVYDTLDNLISETDETGAITQYQYDAKNQRIKIKDPLGNETSYTYDTNGNLQSVTDPLNHITSYSYDLVNRLVTATDPLGNKKTYSYDQNGNKVSEINEENHETKYEYDSSNRLSKITDAKGGVTKYDYDVVGNRTKITDTNNHETVYEYDSMDNLTKETDALGNVIKYSYNAAGKLQQKTKADGTILNYNYDALNRLIKSAFPDQTNQFSYDATGNRIQLQDSTGTTTFTYDSLNRLTKTTYPNGKVLSYGYDAAGRKTFLTYSDGKEVQYEYDANGRLTKVHDWDGKDTVYSYDAEGNLKQQVMPNDTESDYDFDNANRLTRITNKKKNGDEIGSFVYDLDKSGNRKSVTDKTGKTEYQYDELAQLIKVKNPDGKEISYSYDPAGNRATKSATESAVINYSNDAGNRLNNFGDTDLEWDKNGNIGKKGHLEYTFNTDDRLTKVASDGAVLSEFTYDAYGLRRSKNADGKALSYLVDYNMNYPSVIEEDSSGSTRRYIYGLGLIADKTSSGGRYYLTDGLGSTRYLTNTDGNTISAYSYDEFGILSDSDPSQTSFLYTGQQNDSETGLYYLRARYYDPEIGRFISKDLFLPNNYLYANNNPSKMIDPSGLWSLDDLFGAWGRSYRLNAGGTGGWILSGGGSGSPIGIDIEHPTWNPLDMTFKWSTKPEITKEVSTFGLNGGASGNIGISEYRWVRTNNPQAAGNTTICVGGAIGGELGTGLEGTLAGCFGEGKTGVEKSISLTVGAGAKASVFASETYAIDNNAPNPFIMTFIPGYNPGLESESLAKASWATAQRILAQRQKQLQSLPPRRPIK